MKRSAISIIAVVLLSSACASDPQPTATSSSGAGQVATNIRTVSLTSSSGTDQVATNIRTVSAAGPKALCLGFPDKCVK
jgi:hypothetical protein